MPRLHITLTVMDDDNRPLHRENCTSIGYEDFNNPALTQEDESGLLVNETELNLLERVRTAIDRTMLRFARGERRRHEPRRIAAEVDMNDFVGPYDDVMPAEVAEAPNPNHSPEHINELLTRMSIVDGLVDGPSRQPKPVKRPSRYERKPVI